MSNVKILLLTLIFLPIYQSSAEENSDKYPYITLPKAEQSFDLHDQDFDGVINARDKCPGTPRDAKIDNDGCGSAIKSSQSQKLHILFPNDSSEIPPVFLNQIRQMSEFLILYPETSIELQGYASKTGESEYNQKLSEERSNAVRLQLIRLGVTPNRIRIVGFGDSNLISQGESQISHAQNRRVTATVIGYRGEFLKEWTIFTTLPK